MLGDNQRYEVKMVFSGLHLGEIRSWVLAHTDSFRKAFPPRQVNNIYFDTWDFELKAAHVQGVAERAKLRFRWYGETWLAHDGQLEIKIKKSNLGYKEIQAILGDIDISRVSWSEILEFLKSRISDRFLYILNNTVPVLINLYQREYYVSFDGLVRVTLDYDMRAFSQSFWPKPNINKPQPLQNVIVIEMKANVVHDQRISDALAQFPLYCSAFSKYLTGIEKEC
jgi:hypothetical protein